MYREATFNEIQLAFEQKKRSIIFDFWKTFSDEHVPNAVKVKFSYDSEYDDEGGYYDYLARVCWFDADDNEIDTDIDNDDWHDKMRKKDISMGSAIEEFSFDNTPDSSQILYVFVEDTNFENSENA